MRTVLNSVLAAASLATLGAIAAFDSAAQVYSPECPIAGRYSVVGRIPGATGQYVGEAIISASGSGCYMKWFPPNASEGTGTYVGNVLKINFTFENGGSGVVTYTRTGTGVMHGTWYMLGNPDEVGTETISPISYAPR